MEVRLLEHGNVFCDERQRTKYKLHERIVIDMAQDSIITDQMKSLLGVEVGPLYYEVERGTIRRFLEALDDPNPLWRDEEYAQRGRYGGIITPPGFVLSLRRDDLVPPLVEKVLSIAGSLTGSFKRRLNTADELEYFQPIRPGDTIASTLRLVDLSERVGKAGKMLVMRFEQTHRNEKGELVAKGWHTVTAF